MSFTGGKGSSWIRLGQSALHAGPSGSIGAGGSTAAAKRGPFAIIHARADRFALADVDSSADRSARSICHANKTTDTAAAGKCNFSVSAPSECGATTKFGLSAGAAANTARRQYLKPRYRGS